MSGCVSRSILGPQKRKGCVSRDDRAPEQTNGHQKRRRRKTNPKKKRNKKTLKAPCVFRNEGGPRIESRKMCLAPSRIQWGLKNYEVIAVTIWYRYAGTGAGERAAWACALLGSPLRNKKKRNKQTLKAPCVFSCAQSARWRNERGQRTESVELRLAPSRIPYGAEITLGDSCIWCRYAGRGQVKRKLHSQDDKIFESTVEDFSGKFAQAGVSLGMENLHPYQLRHGGETEDLTSKRKGPSPGQGLIAVTIWHRYAARGTRRQRQGLFWEPYSTHQKKEEESEIKRLSRPLTSSARPICQMAELEGPPPRIEARRKKTTKTRASMAKSAPQEDRKATSCFGCAPCGLWGFFCLAPSGIGASYGAWAHDRTLTERMLYQLS